LINILTIHHYTTKVNSLLLFFFTPQLPARDSTKREQSILKKESSIEDPSFK